MQIAFYVLVFYFVETLLCIEWVVICSGTTYIMVDYLMMLFESLHTFEYCIGYTCMVQLSS
jgi:hypothetical protein